MPKSKREKVVALTKTDKKTKENKVHLIDSVRPLPHFSAGVSLSRAQAD
jgi:hypothetical protein